MYTRMSWQTSHSCTRPMHLLTFIVTSCPHTPFASPVPQPIPFSFFSGSFSLPPSISLHPSLLGDPTGSGGAAHCRVRRQQQADWPTHPASGRPAGRLPPHLAEERGKQAPTVANHLLPNHPQDLRAGRLRR